MTNEEKMTPEEAIAEISFLKVAVNKVMEQALDMAIKALSQEPCDKCVYSTKDGYCQYDDIAEIIPSEQEPTVCDIERDEKWLNFVKEARKEAVNAVLEQIRAELHATAEMHEDGDYYLRDEWIDEYFDKYTKGESDG